MKIKMLYFWNHHEIMDYLKKSLKKLDVKSDYEEIDTRLASGWYVDTVGNHKKKKYKTKEVKYTISKKQKNWKSQFSLEISYIFVCSDIELAHF